MSRLPTRGTGPRDGACGRAGQSVAALTVMRVSQLRKESPGTERFRYADRNASWTASAAASRSPTTRKATPNRWSWWNSTSRLKASSSPPSASSTSALSRARSKSMRSRSGPVVGGALSAGDSRASGGRAPATGCASSSRGAGSSTGCASSTRGAAAGSSTGCAVSRPDRCDRGPSAATRRGRLGPGSKPLAIGPSLASGPLVAVASAIRRIVPACRRSHPWDNRRRDRAGVAEWQTQLTQNQPRATSWGFESPSRYHRAPSSPPESPRWVPCILCARDVSTRGDTEEDLV